MDLTCASTTAIEHFFRTLIAQNSFSSYYIFQLFLQSKTDGLDYFGGFCSQPVNIHFSSKPALFLKGHSSQVFHC